MLCALRLEDKADRKGLLGQWTEGPAAPPRSAAARSRSPAITLRA
jgi:hypothetical protein